MYRLQKKYNYPAIYRVHEPPSPEKYKSLIDIIGIPLANILIGKVPHPILMNKILANTKQTADYDMINPVSYTHLTLPTNSSV